jgi:hypothetical protein
MVPSTNLFGPDYQTPRSLQMNVGIQHEFGKGMVFTADYLRNISTHTLLAVDTNHVGDARFLNVANANAAIAATNSGSRLRGERTRAYRAPSPVGATISSYAVNGLDSGYGLCGGAPCPAAAFGGINDNLGGNQMLFPIGRAVYNGLQMSWRQDVKSPVPGIHYLNLQVSYALSRYVAMAQDSDFINSAWDYADPTKVHGTGRPRPQKSVLLRRHCGVACAFPRERDRALLQPARSGPDAWRPPAIPAASLSPTSTETEPGTATVPTDPTAASVRSCRVPTWVHSGEA